jgi:hypothetical protein
MKIGLLQLLNSAKSLKSEDGENPEYDRALVELIADVSGHPMEQSKPQVAALLGIKLS